MKNDPKIIVALDNLDLKSVNAFVSQVTPELCRLKIGNILFTRYGPSLVEELMKKGFGIFLDLKFHDIPNTVAQSCRSAAELGVWMVNLHVVSGVSALKKAREVINSFKQKPLLIGVTILTSLDEHDLQTVGIEEKPILMVERLTGIALQEGLDGVVCSPQEITLLREKFGKDFLLVTPGIRLHAGNHVDDQKRVMTPQDAIKHGTNYLVIGRPITEAENPLRVLKDILKPGEF